MVIIHRILKDSFFQLTFSLQSKTLCSSAVCCSVPLRPEALSDLYAYAFKVSYDRRRGHMVYLRVYSGELRPHTTVYNITRDSE